MSLDTLPAPAVIQVLNCLRSTPDYLAASQLNRHWHKHGRSLALYVHHILNIPPPAPSARKLRLWGDRYKPPVPRPLTDILSEFTKLMKKGSVAYASLQANDQPITITHPAYISMERAMGSGAQVNGYADWTDIVTDSVEAEAYPAFGSPEFLVQAALCIGQTWAKELYAPPQPPTHITGLYTLHYNVPAQYPVALRFALALIDAQQMELKFLLWVETPSLVFLEAYILRATNGAEINDAVKYGRFGRNTTFLTTAIQLNYARVVKVLLEKKVLSVNISARDNQALCQACSQNHWELAKMLASRSDNVNGHGDLGFASPLSFVAATLDRELLDTFMAFPGADIAACPGEALFLACWQAGSGVAVAADEGQNNGLERGSLIAFLFSVGCGLGAFRNEILLAAVRDSGTEQSAQQPLYETILEHPESRNLPDLVNDALIMASLEHNLVAIRHLLNKGANPNHTLKIGRLTFTPLRASLVRMNQSAQSDPCAALKLLLRSGADANDPWILERHLVGSRPGALPDVFDLREFPEAVRLRLRGLRKGFAPGRVFLEQEVNDRYGVDERAAGSEDEDDGGTAPFLYSARHFQPGFEWDDEEEERLACPPVPTAPEEGPWNNAFELLLVAGLDASARDGRYRAYAEKNLRKNLLIR
ncbi:hypothetical protein DFJ77DRAFT_507118 [Powellomyces hirtus]|nr:hypothetical protein DFJ77DRAFT_507118 [Powellomyces hirtus]